MSEFIDWGLNPRIVTYKDCPNSYHKTSQDGIWFVLFDPYDRRQEMRYFVVYNPLINEVHGHGATEEEALANAIDILRKKIAQFQDVVTKYDAYKQQEG